MGRHRAVRHRRPHRSRSRGRARSFAVQIPELASVDVHCHDYYELEYVLEGHATHVINGVAQAAAMGALRAPGNARGLPRD